MSSYPHTGAAPITEEVLNPFAYGRGFLEVVIGANPTAGNPFALTLDGRYISRLIAANFTVTTSAAVASRLVTVDYADGNGNIAVSNGAAVSVLAGSAQVFSFNMARGTSEWNTGTAVFAPLFDFMLEPGRILQINVGNIQAADTLTKIVLSFERFPTGPRGYPEGRVGAGARRQHAVRPSHTAHRH
jgi:hypothetical protein